jgi:hypothetical protein
MQIPGSLDLHYFTCLICQARDALETNKDNNLLINGCIVLMLFKCVCLHMIYLFSNTSVKLLREILYQCKEILNIQKFSNVYVPAKFRHEHYE